MSCNDPVCSLAQKSLNKSLICYSIYAGHLDCVKNFVENGREVSDEVRLKDYFLFCMNKTCFPVDDKRAEYEEFVRTVDSTGKIAEAEIENAFLYSTSSVESGLMPWSIYHDFMKYAYMEDGKIMPNFLDMLVDAMENQDICDYLRENGWTTLEKVSDRREKFLREVVRMYSDNVSTIWISSRPERNAIADKFGEEMTDEQMVRELLTDDFLSYMLRDGHNDYKLMRTLFVRDEFLMACRDSDISGIIKEKYRKI